jgi:raffinose/stachyose/melibiose transport system permease protein
MNSANRSRFWVIASMLAPALLIYSTFMIYPMRISFFETVDREQVFVGIANYVKLFGETHFSTQLWNALANNFYFFFIHMLVQNPIGILLAAVLSSQRLRFRGFYRSVFFLPTMLSVAVVGFVWQLILSPLWGIASSFLSAVGLAFLFKPWLGLEDTALTTLSLISVWQNIGIPMMLIYAALLSIPDELIDSARIDGANPWQLFWGLKLPLILPTIALCSILTFIGNFNAFDLIYTTQGQLGLPNFSTDIMGTFLFRTFFGNNLQQGDMNLGATIAMVMFFVILVGVALYLFVAQRRITSYEL